MASTLKINTLTGVTTAGSIAVTGEGNSTTTNLQQGLTKAWLNVDNLSSFDTKDSFNLSSVADTDTAIITPSWTNPFNSANYVGNATSGDLSSGASSPKPYIGTYATGSYKYENAHSSHVDADNNAMTAHGDLA
jgi:hypothetical protein